MVPHKSRVAVRNAVESIRGPLDRNWPVQLETWLWAAAVVMLLSDLCITLYGLHRGLVETNPIAVAALQEFGLFGLAGLKLQAIVVGLIGRRFLTASERWVLPLGIAVPWFAGSAVNLLLLVSEPYL